MRRLVATFAALAVLAPALAAHADMRADEREEPSSMLEFRLGPYQPDIDSEFDGDDQPYETIFNDKTPIHLELEYDRQFWRGVGSLGVGFHIGYFGVKGSAIADDDTRSSDRTRLRVLPLRTSLVYRFDYLQTRFNVPFVISLKGGLDYYLWWVKSENGIADHEDDAGNRSVGRGGTTGWHVAAGFHLLLDFLAPNMASNFENNVGVNNTYLFAEIMMARVNDFGGDGSWDLSDTTAMFGLAFEF